MADLFKAFTREGQLFLISIPDMIKKGYADEQIKKAAIKNGFSKIQIKLGIFSFRRPYLWVFLFSIFSFLLMLSALVLIILSNDLPFDKTIDLLLNNTGIQILLLSFPISLAFSFLFTFIYYKYLRGIQKEILLRDKSYLRKYKKLFSK